MSTRVLCSAGVTPNTGSPDVTADPQGGSVWTYRLEQSAPNPFTATTTIAYQIPTAQRVSLKIYNVAGQLVRTLDKNDNTQFMRWDLNNQSNFPVASGMYIAHIDMPDLGATKVLKFAVIQEQEVLDVF